MKAYTVKCVVESSVEMIIEAESEFDAENIAYHRLYDATGGNQVYIEDVCQSDEEEN